MTANDQQSESVFSTFLYPHFCISAVFSLSKHSKSCGHSTVTHWPFSKKFQTMPILFPVVYLVNIPNFIQLFSLCVEIMRLKVWALLYTYPVEKTYLRKTK